jgi:uncharacterized membrane protein YfcA
MIVIISCLANAGGLGGGPIIIPIFIFFFDYVAAEAIPMSKANILAGALVNIFFITGRK